MTTPVDASMMNPVELFMTADWVVKSVMVGLAAASIWSWTIIIDKAFRFTALNRQADDFDKAVQSGRDRKSTRLNSSHTDISRMPSSA